MNAWEEITKAQTRRQLFKDSVTGLGAIALASLLNDGRTAEPPPSPADPLRPRSPHFTARAKNIIYLHMAGAPSTLDMFDYKPKLNELSGQLCPDSYVRGQQFAFIKGKPKLLGSPHRFAPRGKSGQVMSNVLPHLSTVADDIAIVRSMYTDQFNHAPAQLFVHTGSARLGRPSMGSWLSYGLGTENHELPSFVVLVSGTAAPDGGASLWGSAFLPTIHQGVQLRSSGDPVLFLSNPAGMSREQRRRSIDKIQALNQLHLDAVGDPEIITRIAQYEMAYKMQTSVPELMDITKEPRNPRALRHAAGRESLRQQLLARARLVESGVRFVQLYHWGWDQHGNDQSNDIRYGLVDRCRETDRPVAALIKDLKQRGLLDETLIVWGGEFGRTPMNEERNGSKWLGRDHNQHAFAIWMSGGGVKSGISYGATDELGYHAVENRMHVHDLQATILHLMGLDHTRLTYRFQGRDFRLTDVHGNVINQLIA